MGETVVPRSRNGQGRRWGARSDTLGAEPRFSAPARARSAPGSLESSPALERSEREAGAFLLELILAMTLLSVGVLSFLGSFVANHRAVGTIQGLDRASFALATTAERIAATDLEDVYDAFHGVSIDVPELRSPTGGAAQIVVRCHVDETAIPAAFGPVEDIDGDPGQQTSDASSTYRILPVQLTLTYDTFYGPETREVYTILFAD